MENINVPLEITETIFKGHTEKKQLTVVLIVHNQQYHIKSAIESILAQRTDFIVYINIINNNSTDDTATIISQYQKMYTDKFSIITNTETFSNEKILTTAIQSIDTKYFTILNAYDSYTDNTKLQQQVEILEKHQECSICGHNSEVYTLHNRRIIKRLLFKKKSGIINIKKIKDYKDVLVHPSTRVYRTSALEIENIQNMSILGKESSLFWYFLSRGSLYYLNSVLTIHRQTYIDYFTQCADLEERKNLILTLMDLNQELNHKFSNLFFKEILRVIRTKRIYYILFSLCFLYNRKQIFCNKRINDFLTSVPKYAPKLFIADYANNFGDILNKYLLSYFFKTDFIKTNLFESNTFCIGSALQALPCQIDANNIVTHHIFGNGFINEPKSEYDQFTRPVSIYALRGKLSKDRCQKALASNLEHVPLGDPALLFKMIVNTKKIKKQYDVGIIPHFRDKDANLLANISLETNTYTIIDVTANALEVLYKIAQCRVVISSSLHGLILSDSFSIPNQWINFSDKVDGGGYKFCDYYSCYNLNSNPIDVRKEVITDNTIKNIIKTYSITVAMIDSINTNLIKAFPSRTDFEKEQLQYSTYADLPIDDPQQLDNLRIGNYGLYVDKVNDCKFLNQKIIPVNKNEDLLSLSGWSADFVAKAPLGALFVRIKDSVLKCNYGVYRPDVKKHFNIPSLTNTTGFYIEIPLTLELKENTAFLEFIQISNNLDYQYKPIKYAISWT